MEKSANSPELDYDMCVIIANRGRLIHLHCNDNNLLWVNLSSWVLIRLDSGCEKSSKRPEAERHCPLKEMNEELRNVDEVIFCDGNQHTL